MKKLAAVISEAQRKGWKSGHMIAIDETILVWKGNGTFLVFIPGKPHPQG